jgi:hypothetical protein
MRSLVAVSFLGALIATCAAPPPVSAPSATPTTTVAAPASPNPTPTSTATPAATTGGTFASVCGTISDWVGDSAQADGSFVLNSPGRAPLKITLPSGKLGSGRASGYVCIGVLAGVPHPLIDGFFPGGTRGFVDSGTFPATIASPAPTGFVVPQACAYVVAPVVGTAQTEWKIDCGAANNNNARGTLGAALMQQGWTSCGSGLASAQWRKSDVMLTVSESSLAPGDYPRLSQSRVLSPC